MWHTLYPSSKLAINSSSNDGSNTICVACLRIFFFFFFLVCYNIHITQWFPLTLLFSFPIRFRCVCVYFLFFVSLVFCFGSASVVVLLLLLLLAPLPSLSLSRKYFHKLANWILYTNIHVNVNVVCALACLDEWAYVRARTHKKVYVCWLAGWLFVCAAVWVEE